MTRTDSEITHFFGLILTGAIVAAAIVVAGFVRQSAMSQTNRIAAFQGCYEVARSTKVTSGKSDSSDWQVTTADVNEDLLTKCLQTKGY